MTRRCQASPSPTRTSHRASARPNPNPQQEGLPLIQPLKRAEFFAVSNIRRRFVFGEPGIQRREISEIPREAVRKAIANALPHRDYTTDTAVEVNVYMDFTERRARASSPRAALLKTIWQGQTAASSSATRASRRCTSLGNDRAVRHGHPPYQAILRRRGREVQLQADRQHHRHPIRPSGRTDLHRGKRFNAEIYRRCKKRDSRRSRENRHNVCNRKRTRDKTLALRNSRDRENEGRSNP